MDFPPRLHRRDLAGLRWDVAFAEILQRLPALPGELVIVPHGDERQISARVLNVGIVQIGFVDGAVTGNGCRDVEVFVLLAIFVAHDVAYFAVIHALRAVFRIPDQFVDEIAHVEDEGELVFRRGALILVDHPTISVLRAIVRVLAGHKGKVHAARIVIGRRGDRAADAAAVPVAIGEAIPIFRCGLQTAHQHPHGPVGLFQRMDIRRGHDLLKLPIGGDFGNQARALASPNIWPAAPQQNAGAVGIAGGDALWKEFAAFVPGRTGRSGSLCPSGARPQRRGCRQQFSAGNLRHICPPSRKRQTLARMMFG